MKRQEMIGKELHIRQAERADIPAIEAMYQRRVQYNDEHGIHQWMGEEVRWQAFSALYTFQDYYVGEVAGNVACGLFIVDVDILYWKHYPKGDALYLHKICVDPAFRGRGYADALIAFFKEKGRRAGVAQVRLDVRAHKDKLRAMYERNGFQLLAYEAIHPSFTTALYELRYASQEE